MAGLHTSPPNFAAGGSGATAASTQFQAYINGVNKQSPHSRSTSSSVIIVIVVVSLATVLSTSIYFLLRRCHSSLRTATAASRSGNNRDQLRLDPSSKEDSPGRLPIFTVASVAGNITGGDCAVCLSKFESQDELRLLPLCCHAFHAQCIDAWLLSNQTCPLCRSTVNPTEADVLSTIISQTNGGSFRIEIGNVSRRRDMSDSSLQSNQVGSFDFIVDDEEHQVPVENAHRRGGSDYASNTNTPEPEISGDISAREVADDGGERSWLGEYFDRVAASLPSRTLSFRSSGRLFTESSRQIEDVVPVDDLEGNKIGVEITELFRWFSGV